MNKLFIRTDANSNIGMGHIMRCITIAKALKDIECIFLISDSHAKEIIKENGFSFFCLNVDYKKMDNEEIIKINEYGNQKKVRNILVDSYYVNEKYLLMLKKKFIVGCFNCKDKWLPANYIINYNINCDKELYRNLYKSHNTTLLLGSEYVPLRAEFVETTYTVKDSVKHVLVMTGGSDYYNFMGQFIEKICLKPECKDIKFTFISGMYNTNFDYLQQVAKNTCNVKIIYNEKNISKCMSENDLVISAGGTTAYELCAIGVPTILFCIASNQISESEFMGKNNIVKYIGNYGDENFWNHLEDVFFEIVKDKSYRKTMSKNMKNIVDGKGTLRIAQCIKNVTGTTL